MLLGSSTTAGALHNSLCKKVSVRKVDDREQSPEQAKSHCSPMEHQANRRRRNRKHSVNQKRRKRKNWKRNKEARRNQKSYLAVIEPGAIDLQCLERPMSITPPLEERREGDWYTVYRTPQIPPRTPSPIWRLTEPGLTESWTTKISLFFWVTGQNLIKNKFNGLYIKLLY